jgi:hypothetical protein
MIARTIRITAVTKVVADTAYYTDDLRDAVDKGIDLIHGKNGSEPIHGGDLILPSGRMSILESICIRVTPS